MDESIIGGLSSYYLKRYMRAGYAIYLTDKRIIGVNRSDLSTAAVKNLAVTIPDVMLPLGMAKNVGSAQKAADEQAKIDPFKAIGELDATKDFELKRENVGSIELKPYSFWGRGHLIVKSNDGTTIKIIISNKESFEQLTQIFAEMHPTIIN